MSQGGPVGATAVIQGADGCAGIPAGFGLALLAWPMTRPRLCSGVSVDNRFTLANRLVYLAA